MIDSLCDFACGTGTLMLELSRSGKTVFGCDLSPSMYKTAATILKDVKNAHVDHGDMVIYRPPQEVDLATCLFDSVNYLMFRDKWRSFFQNVAFVLRPGGFFIFDYVSLFDLESCWPGYHSVMEGKEWILTRLSEYDRVSGRGIEKMIWHTYHNNHWQTETEIHEHTSLPESLVEEFLADAGLTIIKIMDADTFEKVYEFETTRILVIAQKQG